MTRMSRIAVMVGGMLLATAAAAHGGYGQGPGAAGCGPATAQGCNAGCGPAGACGPAGGPQGLLTPDELTAHRAKMASLSSVDECRVYLADFSTQMKARAKEKGTSAAGPGPWMCDRMQSHGRFTH